MPRNAGAQLLAGVTDPEAKRRIIGEQFWKEFFTVQPRKLRVTVNP